MTAMHPDRNLQVHALITTLKQECVREIVSITTALALPLLGKLDFKNSAQRKQPIPDWEAGVETILV